MENDLKYEKEKRKSGGSLCCPLHEQTIALIGSEIDKKLLEKELKISEKITACVLVARNELDECISCAKRDVQNNIQHEIDTYGGATPVWEHINALEKDMTGVKVNLAKWAGAFIILAFFGQIAGGCIVSVVIKSALENMSHKVVITEPAPPIQNKPQTLLEPDWSKELKSCILPQCSLFPTHKQD